VGEAARSARSPAKPRIINEMFLPADQIKATAFMQISRFFSYRVEH